MILIAAAGTLLAAVLVTALMGRLAPRLGALDPPTDRKPHAEPMPTLGGLGVLVGILVGVLVLTAVSDGAGLLADRQFAALIGGALFIGLVGAVDDMRPLSPWTKLAGQIVAAGAAVALGVRVEAIGDPLGDQVLALGWIGSAASLLWIVAAVNAVNLIDGLDGLCAGVAAIAATALAAVAAIHGQLGAFALMALTAAAALGLLYHNTYPARIFPGDSGSMALGFLLGGGALWAAENPATGAVVLAPALLVLALPLADTGTAVLRRLLQVVGVARHQLPERERFEFRLANLPRLFTADRDHIHHRLLDRGLSPRRAVTFLWALGGLSGVVAVVTTVRPELNPAVLAVAAGFGAYLILFQLRYHELRVLRKGLLLPVFDRRIIARRWFHGLIDLVLAGAAYAVAHIVVHASVLSHGRDELWATLPVVMVVELGVLYLSGLYRGAYRHASVGEALRVIRSVVLAATAAAIGLMVVHGAGLTELATYVINGLLLLVLVLGSRVSFRVLDYVYEHGRAGTPTVLYGAGRGGDLALRELMSNPNLGWRPVGFIDDQAYQRGRYFGGYPILGTLADLPDVAADNGVEQVVLTTRKLTAERRVRLMEICRQHGLRLGRFTVGWETLRPDLHDHDVRTPRDAAPDTDRKQLPPADPAPPDETPADQMTA